MGYYFMGHQPSSRQRRLCFNFFLLDFYLVERSGHRSIGLQEVQTVRRILAKLPIGYLECSVFGTRSGSSESTSKNISFAGLGRIALVPDDVLFP